MIEKIPEEIFRLQMAICLRCASQPVITSWWEPSDRAPIEYCYYCEDKQVKVMMMELRIPVSLLNDETCRKRWLYGEKP
jgi:hypothetical protein